MVQIVHFHSQLRTPKRLVAPQIQHYKMKLPVKVVSAGLTWSHTSRCYIVSWGERSTQGLYSRIVVVIQMEKKCSVGKPGGMCPQTCLL